MTTKYFFKYRKSTNVQDKINEISHVRFVKMVSGQARFDQALKMTFHLFKNHFFFITEQWYFRTNLDYHGNKPPYIFALWLLSNHNCIYDEVASHWSPVPGHAKWLVYYHHAEPRASCMWTRLGDAHSPCHAAPRLPAYVLSLMSWKLFNICTCVIIEAYQLSISTYKVTKSSY